MPTPENRLPKGAYAIAHVETRGYSLVAGAYGYSRYSIVRITRATRDGTATAYIDWAGDRAPKRVDRFTTIYAFPVAFAAVAERAFNAQALDFIGYETKAELKAALEALAAESQQAA